MQRKPQASTISIPLHGEKKGKGMIGATWHPKMPLMWLHPKQDLMGIRCSHTNIDPLRVPNMAKPRTREANTSIKHRSKQA